VQDRFLAGAGPEREWLDMASLLGILLRVFLLYFVLKLLWSLFAGRKNTIATDRGKTKASPRRFDTHGENVADADYDEVK
jgi:hypothetical protein